MTCFSLIFKGEVVPSIQAYHMEGRVSDSKRVRLKSLRQVRTSDMLATNELSRTTNRLPIRREFACEPIQTGSAPE